MRPCLMTGAGQVCSCRAGKETSQGLELRLLAEKETVGDCLDSPLLCGDQPVPEEEEMLPSGLGVLGHNHGTVEVELSLLKGQRCCRHLASPGERGRISL